MKDWLKIPLGYTADSLAEYLQKYYKARHVRSHDSHLIKVRDAIKFDNGVIMSVIQTKTGYILLENNKITDQLFKQTLKIE